MTQAQELEQAILARAERLIDAARQAEPRPISEALSACPGIGEQVTRGERFG